MVPTMYHLSGPMLHSASFWNGNPSWTSWKMALEWLAYLQWFTVTVNIRQILKDLTVTMHTKSFFRKLDITSTPFVNETVKLQ